MSKRRGRPRPKPRVIDQRPAEAISKQPVVIHGVADIRKGKSSRIVEGGRVVQEPLDLFVRQEARPRPEQPRSFYNFEEMQQDLADRIGDIHKRFKINMGAPPEAKKTGRFLGKGGLLTETADWRKAISRKGWIGWHPVLFIERFFSRKVGRRAYKRDVTERNRTIRIRRRFEDPARQLVENYHAEMAQALQQLQAAVESGRINWENRNFQLNEYKKRLDQIEKRFLHQRHLMMERYMKEKNSRRTA